MSERKTLVIALVASVLLTCGCKDEMAEADELLATGDPDGAIAIYEARLAKKPGDGTATIGLARALYTAGIEKAKDGSDTVDDWNAVVAQMEDAVLVDPPPEGVTPIDDQTLGDAWYRAGMHRYEAEDWRGTAEALEKASGFGKRSAEGWATMARAMHEAGDDEAAFKWALKAKDEDPGDVAFLREAAGWGRESEAPWMYHRFFYLAEQAKPTGFGFLAPVEIQKGLTKKYPALNLMNDTLGHFLFNEEVDSRAWDGLVEREPMIADMEKFLGKKPPVAFEKADRERLPWIVYHYWNVTGVAYAYLGETDKAKEWFEKAEGVAENEKIVHSEIEDAELETQIGWARANAELLD